MASKNSKKRKSLSMIAFDSDENAGVVSPTYLNPLRRDSCTPGKSILRQSTFFYDYDGSYGDSKRRKSISFSPFNGVKVINHRESNRLSFDYNL
eukprot:CAMPEP_0182417820 /NCGR_PEP_ID=MMETSP1167-20130531/2262_1 /TAXON_ID=2988 /ORGANISM="Mallomonas Sp, Strain CCMP3275" /LENGTH=93 /DNA_ID=CAMNT_0024591615 /DNA_START=324 /DNA_END=605 /DNA_ORIENTATION=+